MSHRKQRCFGDHLEIYADYHDEEWGVPEHDDRKLFELLVLEGAQAGLSWETILKKRDAYRRLFHNFDPAKVAAMSDAELERVLSDPGIVRNRLKVFAARKNAVACLEIQREFGSLDAYLWSFVSGKPIVGGWKRREEVPCSTPESERLSKDLKRRGMTFVGPTIIYAFMQAVGMVNDHLPGCWKGST